MAGTMEGLGVPLFGGYTSYQSDGTTSFLTVNADGSHDFSFTDEGVDNFISVTVAESAAISSGYLQAFYANISTTGVWTGGQINGFALDMTLSGTPGVEVAGAYFYFSETGTTVTTNLNLNGVVVYFEEMSGDCSMRAGFKAYSDDDGVAGNLDAGFVTVSANAGLWGAMLGHSQPTYPNYFLWCQHVMSGSTPGMFVDHTPGDTAGKALRINMGGTIYNIPCVADSCS